MIIVTSECDYKINKVDETRNIVENTVLEHEQKYGGKYRKIIKVKCVAEFLDKVINETKNITIERYNIIGELNKTMQSSNGMIKFIRVIELKIIIKGRNCIDTLDYSLEGENIPVLGKKMHENSKR